MYIHDKSEKKLLEYYATSEKAYINWSQVDNNQPYSLHCGIHPEGRPIEQRGSVDLMTSKVVELASIDNSVKRVLDAGCGVGSIGFLISKKHPEVNVVGVNIVPEQIQRANEFKNSLNLSNINFQLKSYDDIQEPSDKRFDRVIFCESLCHSENQETTLHRINNNMSQGGKLIICDLVLSKKQLTEEETKWLQDYQSGWIVPEVRDLKEFEGLLSTSGFTNIQIKDESKEVLPSSQRFGSNAAMRLRQGGEVPTVIGDSRYACVGSNALMESGAFKYIIATATK